MENLPSSINGEGGVQETAWGPMEQNGNKVEREASRDVSKERGMKALLAIGYEGSHSKDIGDIYNQAIGQGAKFNQGSPAKRRLEALLEYIDGPNGENVEYERRLMEDATESLTSACGPLLKDKLKSTLDDWSEYFGGESCAFPNGKKVPAWFKLWAWDGMTRLGKWNTKTKRYERRSKETIATFPPLDKEVLQDVYSAMEEGADEEVRGGLSEQEVEKYNFNSLYSHFVNKHIVPTPEYGQPVSGSWKEYGLEDKEEVSQAANGTGWCIVSSTKAQEYLERPSGSFTFLHLNNPTTGELDRHACASIRMEDEDGEGAKVVEISGRKSGSGQMLEDALVETVEAKVLSMPGGEKYRQAFADRKELIRLAKKEEELTTDELNFVYEVNRPIAKLETHSVTNDHVVELRTKYDVETAVLMGVDREALINRLVDGSNDVSVNEENVLQNMEGLFRIGADHDRILGPLTSLSVYDNFDRLAKNGVAVEKIMRKIGSQIVAAHLGGLFDKGIDIALILDTLGEDRPSVKDNVGVLLDHGAPADRLMQVIWPEDVLSSIEIFRAHGAEIDANSVLGEMSAIEKMRSYDAIKAAGLEVGISDMMGGLDPDTLWDSSRQVQIREFLMRDDIDPLVAANAISGESMEYLRFHVVAALNNSLKKSLREARSGGDESTQSRIEALRAKIIEFGGRPTDTWY